MLTKNLLELNNKSLNKIRSSSENSFSSKKDLKRVMADKENILAPIKLFQAVLKLLPKETNRYKGLRNSLWT
jgi:hypothetical protein